VTQTTEAERALDACLVLGLIHPKREDLVWRLCLEQKIGNDVGISPKVLEEISKGFASYPPSKRDIAEKKKRGKLPPKSAAQ
jgi:hypothetical protein